jgi:ABC-2 type transport system permease protein
VGLAWRLQRGALIGWTAGSALLGVAYGSVAKSIGQWVEDNPDLAEFFSGADVVDSYLALTMLISAVIAAAFGVTSALHARGEETDERAEPVLATPTGRVTWLGSHVSVALVGSALVVVAAGIGEGLAYGLSVSDIGQVPRLVAVALVYVPAVWLVVALAVLGFGWVPRLAAVAAWAVVGYCAVVALFADSFDLPRWSQQASPFTHTPQAPVDDVAGQPLVLLGAAVLATLLCGAVGLRRRDIGP